MSIQNKSLVVYVKKNLVLVLGVAAILLLGGFTYLRYDQLAEHEARLVEMRKTRERLSRNAANSTQLAAHLENMKKINAEIAKRALRPSELARNLQVFYKLENSTGVKFTSDVQQMSPASVPPSAAYTRLAFRLNISAEYPDFLEFLRQVEVELVASKINSVSFWPAAQGAGTKAAAIVVEVLAHKS